MYATWLLHSLLCILCMHNSYDSPFSCCIFRHHTTYIACHKFLHSFLRLSLLVLVTSLVDGLQGNSFGSLGSKLPHLSSPLSLVAGNTTCTAFCETHFLPWWTYTISTSTRFLLHFSMLEQMTFITCWHRCTNPHIITIILNAAYHLDGACHLSFSFLTN